MTIPNIATDVTVEDQQLARTTIRALLQEQDPTLDISVGGSVDSLLVEGNVAVVGRNDVEVDRAYLFQQLKAISEGTVTVSDADLDNLMANYFLTRIQSVPAVGDVQFIVRDLRVYSFPAGYSLTSNNQVFVTPRAYTVYPAGTPNIDFSLPQNILLEQVFDPVTGFGYRFRFEVVSLNAVPTAALVAGDILTPTQAFDGLGRVTAATNFQGGTPRETNQQFASRGLQGLLAQTVGGQDNINKLVREAVPNADSSTVGVNSVMMTRDRDNVFNLSVGGKIDVYMKSGALGLQGLLVDAVVVDPVLRIARITLTREQSAGVYRVGVVPISTTTPPVVISGSITITNIDNLPYVDPTGFNPEMPTQIERAFSASQLIEITFVDNRQTTGPVYVVPMGVIGSSIVGAYEVNTVFQPQTLAVSELLLSSEVRPPGLDVLVKGAVPCLTTVGMVIQRPVNYNGPSASSLSASIATAINLLPVATPFLDGFTLSAIVREIDPQLAVQSLSLTGTIYGQNGVDYPLSQINNRLTLPTNTVAKISPSNTYFTTNSSLVTVTLV